MRFAPALRFFRRNPAASLEQDPADMGTAFGMEASLDGSNDYRSHTPEPVLESQRISPNGLHQESPLAWLSKRSS
ncbi:hypothetical protein [Roseateles koreensis]|uniref:Uncharacterized protein n=1 Tax=Roseateles koreensis TaxID=2987526 RepID=A0ABT5KSQ2_9BURK|nr:hypothetical protein [Roseateles koreensis]MDC8784807.1 hypothetical protein [Roseateles koreensis]